MGQLCSSGSPKTESELDENEPLDNRPLKRTDKQKLLTDTGSGRAGSDGYVAVKVVDEDEEEALEERRRQEEERDKEQKKRRNQELSEPIVRKDSGLSVSESRGESTAVPRLPHSNDTNSNSVTPPSIKEWCQESSDIIFHELLKEGYNHQEWLLRHKLKWSEHYANDPKNYEPGTTPERGAKVKRHSHHRRKGHKYWMSSSDPIRAYMMRTSRKCMSHVKIDQLFVRWKGRENELCQRFHDLWNKERAKQEGILEGLPKANEPVPCLRALAHCYRSTGQTLGKGAFGLVYKMKTVDQQSDGQSQKKSASSMIVAGKLMNRAAMEASDDGSLEGAIDEINILRRMDHPYIFKYLDSFESPVSLCIISEYLNGGDLFEFITTHKEFSISEAALYFEQVLSALHYLHSEKIGIVHRDLKPANIMFDRRYDGRKLGDPLPKLKLVDFGTAVVLNRGTYDSYEIREQVGTPEYMAPEVVCDHAYGLSVDIWSAGCVLYVMLSGHQPFQFHTTLTDLANSIVAPKYKKLFGSSFWTDTVGEEGISLVKSLLTVPRKNRLTAEQALKHPWFAHAKDQTAPMNEYFQNQINMTRLRLKMRRGIDCALAAVRLVYGLTEMQKREEELKKKKQSSKEQTDADLLTKQRPSNSGGDLLSVSQGSGGSSGVSKATRDAAFFDKITTFDSMCIKQEMVNEQVDELEAAIQRLHSASQTDLSLDSKKESKDESMTRKESAFKALRPPARLKRGVMDGCPSNTEDESSEADKSMQMIRKGQLNLNPVFASSNYLKNLPDDESETPSLIAVEDAKDGDDDDVVVGDDDDGDEDGDHQLLIAAAVAAKTPDPCAMEKEEEDSKDAEKQSEKESDETTKSKDPSPPTKQMSDLALLEGMDDEDVSDAKFSVEAGDDIIVGATLPEGVVSASKLLLNPSTPGSTLSDRQSSVRSNGSSSSRSSSSSGGGKGSRRRRAKSRRKKRGR